MRKDLVKILVFVPVVLSLALLFAMMVKATAHNQNKPAPGQPSYELTELQKARLEATREEFFRWKDKMDDTLGRFSALCTQAQKENKWPNVQCSLEDLKVTPLPIATVPVVIPKK
jgi:hypothetical protein